MIDSCGYLLVPPFHGGNPKQMLAYADTMQLAIQKLYDCGIKGWVVDLRQNTGGNMAPMIAGLGPLLSAERSGALIDVNGKAQSWHYQNGRHFWDGDTGWAVSKPARLGKALPIAVLTGSPTGSSGEIVAVSFIGNTQTRSFGEPTWGLTTGNGSFDLSDGSQIYLASTIMADRNGKRYTGRISPDVIVDPKATAESDPVLNAALKWIRSSSR